MKKAEPLPYAITHRVCGFTLTELMIAVAVLAILAALAAPGFANVTRRLHVDTVREQFIGSMNLARTEAIRQGRSVVIRRIEPCIAANVGTQWYCGWHVFVDLNQNNTLDVSEPLLREVPGDPNVRIERTNPVGGAFIQFTRFGLPNQSALSFQIFPASQDAANPTNAQRICMSDAGRARTVKDKASCA